MPDIRPYMAEHSARLRQLLSAPRTPDASTYVAEMLSSKHEGLQSGALKVLSAWGDADAKAELQRFLCAAFERPYGWAVRSVAISGLERLLTLDDAAWLRDLDPGLTTLQRHELRALKWRLHDLRRQRELAAIHVHWRKWLRWLREIFARSGRASGHG